MTERKTMSEIYLSFDVDEENILAKKLDEAHKRGVAEGRIEGEKIGFERGQEKSLEKHYLYTKSIIEELNQNINEITLEMNKWKEFFTPLVVQAIESVCHKLIPLWYEKNGIDEIKKLVEKISLALLDDIAFQIFINPQFKNEAHEYVISELNYPASLVIVEEDNTLKEMEFKLRWKGGGVDWSANAVMKKIDDLFQPHLSTLINDEMFEQKSMLSDENKGDDASQHSEQSKAEITDDDQDLGVPDQVSEVEIKEHDIEEKEKNDEI